MKQLLLTLALVGGVLAAGDMSRANPTGAGPAGLNAAGLSAAGGWSVAPVSAMHKLTATQPGEFEAYPKRPAQLVAARGEWESLQVVVTAGDAPLRNVRISSTPLVSPSGYVLEAGNIAVFHERFVRAAQPSGNRRLEKLWWSDALVPQGWQPVQVPPHHSAAFWVALRVPEAAQPADYYGALAIESDAGQKHLFVGVQVQKVEVPAPTMRATAALYYDTLREWYTQNIGPQDPAVWEETKRAYYDFLLDYRINAYDLPVGPDDAAFGAYARNPAVLSIRTPELDSAGFAPFLKALDASDARGKAFYYRHDEPSPEQYPAIKAEVARLHAAGVPQLVTMAPNGKLLKAVDIWCPNIGDALGLGHLDLEALAWARRRGEGTWWYTMTVPRAPYPTWLLDDAASSVRVYGWQMARWGLGGFVYSMVHGWGPKPLEDLRSFAGSNGDGTLLYPGETAGGQGPMPSIRLMLLRDAIEDYELLQTLSPAARLAVTSRAVGASPWQRRDTDQGWENETYRQALFAALAGRAVPPAPPPAPETVAIPISMAKLPHTTDGIFEPGEWPRNTEAAAPFRRLPGDTGTPPQTQLYLARRGGRLLVAVRAANAGKNEWCAVELAPVDASEKWRFVVTSGGKMAVERHTREGHFAIEGAQWNGAVRNEEGLLLYEWSLPLDLVADAGEGFRFNVLRRVDDRARDAKYTVRAWEDAGDVTRMPLTRMPLTRMPLTRMSLARMPAR